MDCKKSNFKAWEELHQNSVRLTRKLNRILQVEDLKLLLEKKKQLFLNKITSSLTFPLLFQAWDLEDLRDALKLLGF